MGSNSSDEPKTSALRMSPRYVFEQRIRIRVERTSQKLVMEGWSRDISETGLCAFVGQELIAGETVSIEIPLASSDTLVIPAKVANCLGTQYGLQFTALSAEQRAHIQFALRNRPENSTHEETIQSGGIAFADRARELIKRGYTLKIAVELALHEMEAEHANNPRIIEKMRADAEDFLMKAHQGLM